MLEDIKQEIKDLLEILPADFGWGCPLEKALVLAEYILSENMTYSVEIGVYKGRSFFPQAIAHKYTGGIIIGIYPFLKVTAREKDVSEELRKKIDTFIDLWDTTSTYLNNLENILKLKLGNNAFIF